MELTLNKMVTLTNGKFEIALIRWDELCKGFTTSDVLVEAVRLGYIIPTKAQAYDIKSILGIHYADNLGTWIVVSLYENGDSEYKYESIIVSGICCDNEGKSVPSYGKNPNHIWGQGIAFAFLREIKI